MRRNAKPPPGGNGAAVCRIIRRDQRRKDNPSLSSRQYFRDLARRHHWLGAALADAQLARESLGRSLLKARQSTPRGQFGRLLDRLGIHRRRAYRLMAAARRNP